MTLTRSQRGVVPRKPEIYGLNDSPAIPQRRSSRQAAETETPSQKGKRGRPRKSTPSPPEESSEENPEDSEPMAEPRSNGHLKPRKAANGSPAVPNGATRKANGAPVAPVTDPKVDTSGVFEFGGTPGVTALMIGFPALMYYMWVGATYYDGKPPMPTDGQSLADFFQHMGHLIYEGAFPSLKAWTIYWTFFIFEAICYLVLPGVTTNGKPLPHENGKQLKYYCSGMWSFYVSIAIAAVLHVTGVFKLYVLLDEFGPIMSVAILSGFLVAIVAYVSAVWRGATHRMTGHLIYDFFMGAELNPRMFGILDFKMFFEVRIPWYILFFTTVSAAARQYERYGYVSLEVSFLLMAHYLYANACSKGEELIATTWDMYYEKWGFMLIFWNLAGVPLSYCHCTIFLANHHPSEYAHSKPTMAALFVAYLFVYWVWDSANSQKNRFRQSQRGGFVARRAFPQVPWQTLHNPRTIPTKTGDPLLADGWFRYARKVNYTCDLFFALSWAGICGLHSPFPWFYPVFFSGMIVHRALRDIERCRLRYGEAWSEYERLTPYLFIPYVF